MKARVGPWILVSALMACATARGPAPPAPNVTSTRLDSLAVQSLSFAQQQYRAAAAAYDPAKGYARSTGPDGSWRTRGINEWTSGFFPGVLWQLYAYTGDPALREQAERWTLPLAAIPNGKYSHDLGFQFNTSFGNAYRFTGDQRFLPPVLNAARLLAARFNPPVGAIKSWDWMDPKRPYPVIVDNMMNLELLFWAARKGGDQEWPRLAVKHAQTTIANHLRADGGSYHVVVFDPNTGAALERITHQGFADSSTWARGQAWLIYGFTMAYRETHDARFLQTARQVSDYALARLPADHVPCWDYQAPGCPETAERDASAAAIMASGLLELSTHVTGSDAVRYRAAAEGILGTLASPAYLARGTANQSLLLHSVGSKPGNSEVDVGMIYADYYFVEALLRYLELRGLQPAHRFLAGAAEPAPGAAAPRVLTLRADALLSVRARLRHGDPELQRALEALVTQADSALHVGPISVMDKKRVPPSGDRHDYISLGPYWWPDPSKPGGLPYIRKDGLRNPEIQQDYDSPRLKRLTAAVNTLALAYYFTGNERYAQHASVLLRAWFLEPATRMNPNLEYGQGIPGITAGRGIGIIETHQLPRLLDDVALLQGSQSWTARDEQGMREWMSAFLKWLQTSKNGRDEFAARNNHGSWYDVQTAGLALFLGRTDEARRILETSKEHRIAVQVKADGSQPLELERTRSLHYSAFNLEALMQLAEIGRKVGVDLWHYEATSGGSIRKALDYLAPYTTAANRWPYQDISAIEPDLLLLPLRMGELVYGDARYRALIAQIPPEIARTSRVQILFVD